MGVHENKYPLHSRLMHYFAPPVHSAMFILNRRAIRWVNSTLWKRLPEGLFFTASVGITFGRIMAANPTRPPSDGIEDDAIVMSLKTPWKRP